MEILFNIIHSHFDRIPEVLSLQRLFKVLVVAEKYDMTQLVRPWIKDWFAPHRENVRPNHYALMLCTTWELGAEAIFTDIAKSMCVECGINSSGQLVIEYLYPRQFYPHILDKRWETLALSGHLEPPGLLGKSPVYGLLSCRQVSAFELADFHIPIVLTLTSA
jgi:hypothetical protein